MEEVITRWGHVDRQLVSEATAFAGCGVSTSFFGGDAAGGGSALGDDSLYACDVCLEPCMGLRNVDGVCGGGKCAVHRGAATQPVCIIAGGFKIMLAVEMKRIYKGIPFRTCMGINWTHILLLSDWK